MADQIVFVVSLLMTIVALILGFIYLRSRSKSFLRLRKDLSAATDDERESTNDDIKSSSATSKPKRWSTEEPSNSQSSGSSRNQVGDTVEQRDAMDYCDHIQREMKRAKHRLAMEKIEAEMTEEQKEEERQTQKQQLEEIFRLMQNNKEEFGLSSVDEIQEQMKLYINT